MEAQLRIELKKPAAGSGRRMVCVETETLQGAKRVYQLVEEWRARLALRLLRAADAGALREEK